MDRGRTDTTPRLSPLLQHALLAGPFFGFLAAFYQYQTWQSSTDRAVVATHHVVRCLRAWRGRTLDTYYITPIQWRIEEGLAIPVACWMILLLGGLVISGIRIDAERRRSTRSSSTAARH